MTAKPSYEELERRVQELEIVESDYKLLLAVSHENESLFKRPYEKAPLGYQSLDEDGCFLVVNSTWLDTLGYAKEEVIGKSFAEFLHPDWQDHFIEKFPRFKSIGEILGEEFEMVKKNGDFILVSFTGKISRDKQGAFQQTHCIFHDTTERKQAEDALRESEAKFRAMVETFPLAIHQSVGVEQITEYMNPTMVKLFGYTQADIPSVAQWWPLAYPDETYRRKIAEEWTKKVKHAIATQSSIEPMEVVCTCKDGSKKNISWNYITLGDKNYSCGLDITERKQAEEALRESDERNRKYLMNAPYGIFVTDEKGGYLQVNPTACNMSGYEEQELLAMSIADLLFKENIEKGLQHFQRVLHQGQSQGELLFRRKNGERRWWTVNAVKISDTQFIGYCIDVTERKQADGLIQKRILSLTQPMEYSEIKLEDLFNLDELQTVQDQFALATGVASIITRIDGTTVTTPSNFTRLCSEIIRKTEQGCANCVKSDAALGCYNPGGPIVQPCLSSGLWDAGINIVVGGHHIANWMIGQVRNEAQSEDGLRAYAALIGTEEEPFMQAFREVPSMSVEQFENIAQAFFTLVNQLCNTAYQNVLQARFIAERKQAEKDKDRL